MKYRIASVYSAYKGYFEEWYSRNPNYLHMSYDQCMREHARVAYHPIKYISAYVDDVEHAHFLLYGGGIVQRKWAEEHGMAYVSDEHVLIEQLKSMQPDVVYFETRFSSVLCQEIRRCVPSVKLIAAWHGTGLTNHFIRLFASVDLVFTCLTNVQRELRARDIPACLMTHCFDSSVLSLLGDTASRRYDVSFIGSLFIGYQMHNTRGKFICSLLKRKVPVVVHSDYTPVQLSKKRLVYELVMRCIPVALRCGILRVARRVGILLPEPTPWIATVRAAVKPPLYGLDMFEGLARSDVSLHVHIDAAENASAMRLFEATGVASCVLTDWKPGLDELFHVDKELCAYRSLDECVEKLQWLMNHPNERKRIAQAGQQRTLQEHTPERYVKRMHEYICQALTQRAKT